MAEDIRIGGGRVAIGFDGVGPALRIDSEDRYQQCRGHGCAGLRRGAGQLESNLQSIRSNAGSVLYCTAHCVLYTALYCSALYYTVLYCTVLYCTVLYCTVLYCTVQYCTVLYCTALFHQLHPFLPAHSILCSFTVQGGALLAYVLCDKLILTDNPSSAQTRSVNLKEKSVSQDSAVLKQAIPDAGTAAATVALPESLSQVLRRISTDRRFWLMLAGKVALMTVGQFISFIPLYLRTGTVRIPSTVYVKCKCNGDRSM